MKKLNHSKSQYIGKEISCFKILDTFKTPNQTRYRVKCIKCGEEYIKPITEIKKYKSDGCMKCTTRIFISRSKRLSKYEKLIGTETNAFKILGIDKTDPSHLVVQCKKCGEVCSKLKRNVFMTKGDGCNLCTAQKGLIKGDFYQRYYTQFGNGIRSDKRRQPKEFKLSLNEFKELISSNCYYCGSAPQLKQNLKRRFKDEVRPVNGIDRISPHGDYEYSNCVPCCSFCNYMKSDNDKDEFEDQVVKIYNHIIKRSTTIETTVNTDKGVE